MRDPPVARYERHTHELVRGSTALENAAVQFFLSWGRLQRLHSSRLGSAYIFRGKAQLGDLSGQS